MKNNCLICLLTGVIVYEAFANEHHIHLPHEHFNTVPTQITSVTISGTASTASISQFKLS